MTPYPRLSPRAASRPHDIFRNDRGKDIAWTYTTFFILSWIWQNLAGEGEFQLRFFPVLWGLATTFVLFLIVETLTTSKKAFWAATLLLCNPEFISLTQQARMYTLLSLIVLLSIFLIISSERDPKWRHVSGLYALFTLMLYTHYSAIFIFCALIVYLLARRQRCWELAISWVTALLTFIPWLIYSQFEPQDHLLWLRPFHIIDSISLFVKLSGTIHIFSQDQIKSGMILVPAFIALTTAFIAVWAFISSRNEVRIVLIIILFPIAAATIMELLGFPNYVQIPRYFIVPVAALAAVYAIGLIQENMRYPKVRIGAMFFLLAMNTSGIVGYVYNDRGYCSYLKPAYRQAAQTIKNLKTPFEHTYFVGRKKERRTFTYYYSDNIAFFELFNNPPLDTPDLLNALRIDKKTTGCWIFVSNKHNLVGKEIRMIQLLEEVMPNREEIEINQGLLVHLKREPKKA